MKMDLESLQKQIDADMRSQNQRPLADFEGYSPMEMNQIFYFTFDKDSPIKMQQLSEADYKKIPLLNQVKYLADLIDKNGELTLTKNGSLPTKVVAELYQQGFLKDEMIERGISKLYKEEDALTVHLTRILLELAGLTKKRKGKLSLTKTAKKMLGDSEALLKHLFLTFTNTFNWAYFDGYGENNIGQLGFGFSLVLLSKYGDNAQLDSFYAEKYFKAYPMLLDTIEPSYSSVAVVGCNCYSTRFFERFIDFFGLIKIEKEKKGLETIKHITKTELFDKLISVQPPISNNG